MHRVGLLIGIIIVLALAGCGGGGSSTSAGGTSGGGSTSAESGAGDAQAASGGTDKSFKASSPTAHLTEAEMRSFIEREVDAELTAQGLSEDEISCVNGNIAKMTGEEMAGGVTSPSDATGEPGSVEAYLGGLAEGCL